MVPAPGETSVEVVAEFPEGYFLENLTVRPDDSLLVTAVLQSELWFVPPAPDGEQVDPVLVCGFDHLALAIVETSPDVFHVALSDGYTTHESHLVCLDLRDWSPGEPAVPRTVCTFDERVRALNGGCLLAPGTLLVADCFAGLVWRVDLREGGLAGTADVWLRHDSMAPDPDSSLTPQQPGVNGVAVSPGTGHVYYTNTAQASLLRVPYHARTLAPVGAPQVVAPTPMADDFCLDESVGAAYVTAHRHNLVLRVPLEPGAEHSVVAGMPFDELLVGPSSARWGRRRGEPGRVMFVTTDGGTTALPSDGVRRSAKVVRVRLPG